MFDSTNHNDPGAMGGDFFKELFDQLKQDDSVLRAQLNDQRLMKLTEYDVTHGLMKFKVTTEELQSRFHELKNLVKRGSLTLKELEDDIYTRWGIQEKSREERIREERQLGLPQTEPIGFNVNAIEVADIPEDSPENH